MIGLIQAQFSENTKKLWFYVSLVLFLNSLISTTQLSWDYYLERYSFWDIVLNVTNNPIDILYIFTLISTLVIINPLIGDSWSQNVCVRSGTRRKYFASILITHGMKTALFVLMIPFTCYALSLFYPVSFQDDWGLITAAGVVLTHRPLDLVALSILLLFLRFFCLGLAAKIVVIATKRHSFGVITYLLLSFGIDAGYGTSNALSGRLLMLSNTLVSVYHHGEWYGVNTRFALIYWLVLIVVLIAIGYVVIRKMDLSSRGV